MSSDLHFIRTIDSDDAGQIAKVRVGPVLEQDEALANARLIAAAPELLALLKTLTFVTETVAHLKGLEAELLPSTDAARALIKTIEGKGKHETE